MSAASGRDALKALFPWSAYPPVRRCSATAYDSLLARYFHARGVFSDLDIAALPETQPDALLAAWLALSDAPREAMDAAFREIAALSSEKGCRAILDEAAIRPTTGSTT